MKKLNLFYAIIIIFFIFFIYFLSSIYGYLDYKKYSKYLFDNKNHLEFHYKYSDRINHLRAESFDGTTTGYLFNYLGNSKFDEQILFLGDSWFDQINLVNYSDTLKKLKKFSKKNKISIINGGIASYSPSLMEVQYKILKNDFKINPSIIIIHIDQTDIGDEFCRYKDRKIFNKNGKLIAVNRFDFNKEIFNGIKIYKYSEIKFEKNYLIKFIYISNFTIKYFVEKNFFRIKNIIKYGWKTGDERNYYKCRFKVIKSFLENKNNEANEYFKNSMRTLLESFYNDKKIKKIIISTFPHRDHINKKYNNNVSFLVEDVLKNFDNKIKHLNFSILPFDNINLNDLYVLNDEASHLTPEYHNKLFIEKIINNISY